MIKLYSAYSEALISHSKKLISGTQVMSENAQKKWSFILDGIEERKNFGSRFLEVACNAEGKYGDQFFELYGNELMDPNLMIQNRQAMTKLLSSLIRHKPKSGLIWMKNLIAIDPKLIANYEVQDASKGLMSEIQEEIDKPQEAESDSFKILLEIAALLKIKPGMKK